jgi:hypothetical protein
MISSKGACQAAHQARVEVPTAKRALYVGLLTSVDVVCSGTPQQPVSYKTAGVWTLLIFHLLPSASIVLRDNVIMQRQGVYQPQNDVDVWTYVC